MVMEFQAPGPSFRPVKTTLIKDEGRALGQGIPQRASLWERTCSLYLGGFKKYEEFDEDFEYEEEEYEEEYDEWDEFSEFLDNQRW